MYGLCRCKVNVLFPFKERNQLYYFFLRSTCFDQFVPMSALPLENPESASVCLSVSLSVSLFVFLSVCMSVYMLVCLSVNLSACPSVYLSDFLYVYLPVCLSIHLSVRLPVYLSVCTVHVCLYLQYLCLSLASHDYVSAVSGTHNSISSILKWVHICNRVSSVSNKQNPRSK